MEMEEKRRALLENGGATKTAHAGHGYGRRKKRKTEEDGIYQQFSLAMETDEERKEIVKKMVATAQLVLGLIKDVVDEDLFP